MAAGLRERRRGGRLVSPAQRPRVVALIDGEHYPPVVRFALDQLSAEADVVGQEPREGLQLDHGQATAGTQ